MDYQLCARLHAGHLGHSDTQDTAEHVLLHEASFFFASRSPYPTPMSWFSHLSGCAFIFFDSVAATAVPWPCPPLLALPPTLARSCLTFHSLILSFYTNNTLISGPNASLSRKLQDPVVSPPPGQKACHVVDAQ